MSLRTYQAEALDALERGWQRGLLRLGVALPTGTGKTHVMAELASRHALERVLVLVHRDTLVEQTERRFREHVAAGPALRGTHGQDARRPGLTVGVVKAARNVVSADIVVASVHTLRNAGRLAQLAEPGLIIVDEAHVSMSATYARIFDRWPKSRVAGFTATWTRSDSKHLGDFWQEIVYERGIRWAIREGHLVPPRGLSIGSNVDLSGVKVSRSTGDFNESDLAEALTVEEIRANVVRGYLEHATGRSAVLFAPTQASAEFFRAGLNAAGVPSAGIYATTGPRDRRRIFDSYRRRQVAVLTTCTALAEGWDAPWCSAALMVRPTRHTGLYVQQVGRVLRPWPGKTDALVLDFAGGSGSLDLRTALSMSDPEPDEKQCTRCHELMIRDELGRWTCPDPECVAEQSDEGWADSETVFSVKAGTRPVDLFAGTDVVWLTTDLGVPFVATSTALYFLCEVDGAWNVGTCAPETLTGGRWLAEGLGADEALNYASIVAVDDDPTLASRDAGWRRDARPSDAQVRYCRSIGLPVLPDDTKSSLSNRITQRRASATLAPIGMR